MLHTPTAVTMVDAEKPARSSGTCDRRGMLASNVAEAVAFIHTEAGLAGPDIELIFAPVPFLDHGFTQPPGHGFTVGAILLQPASRGKITLASADPTVAPHIDPHYLDDRRRHAPLRGRVRVRPQAVRDAGARPARRRTDATGPLAHRRR